VFRKNKVSNFLGPFFPLDSVFCCASVITALRSRCVLREKSGKPCLCCVCCFISLLALSCFVVLCHLSVMGTCCSQLHTFSATPFLLKSLSFMHSHWVEPKLCFKDEEHCWRLETYTLHNDTERLVSLLSVTFYRIHMTTNYFWIMIQGCFRSWFHVKLLFCWCSLSFQNLLSWYSDLAKWKLPSDHSLLKLFLWQNIEVFRLVENRKNRKAQTFSKSTWIFSHSFLPMALEFELRASHLLWSAPSFEFCPKSSGFGSLFKPSFYLCLWNSHQPGSQVTF
jgi:hypothetical protein